MTQQRITLRFTAALSAMVFLLFFAQLLALSYPVSISFVFAMLMAGVSGSMSKLSYSYKAFLQRRAFAGKKQAQQSCESHQQRTVEIDLSLEQTFELALDALQSLDNQRVPVPNDLLVRLEMLVPRKQRLKIHRADQEQGLIDAGLRARTARIPEFIDFSRIRIRLDRIDAVTTQVHIESKPNTVFDTYDLGKNLHYVNHIALYLRRESQQQAAELRLRDHQIGVGYDVDDGSSQWEQHQH